MNNVTINVDGKITIYTYLYSYFKHLAYHELNNTQQTMINLKLKGKPDPDFIQLHYSQGHILDNITVINNEH